MTNNINPEFKSYDYLFKILLIGDSGVGKSCVLSVFCDDKFIPTFITTIGIDFKIKTIIVDEKRIKLQIWDTAGQERFRTITNAYYRGAMGIILFYDITDIKSFNNVSNWLKCIQQHANDTVDIILVGNKSDSHDRCIFERDGLKLSQELKVKFFETSAKLNQNINELFYTLTSDIKKRLVDSLILNTNPLDNNNNSSNIILEESQSDNKNKCCGK
jgi:Ras-related protein Rab-8A